MRGNSRGDRAQCFGEDRAGASVQEAKWLRVPVNWHSCGDRCQPFSVHARTCNDDSHPLTQSAHSNCLDFRGDIC